MSKCSPRNFRFFFVVLANLLVNDVNVYFSTAVYISFGVYRAKNAKKNSFGHLEIIYLHRTNYTIVLISDSYY